MFLHSYGFLLSFFFWLWLRRRKIHGDDGMLRTYLLALTAQTALPEIDVGKVVLDGDGTERTLLLTLAATDAGSLAGLHGSSSLVLVDTADKDATALWTLLAQFDDMTRTSLYAGTTRGTLILINLRNTRLRINLNGIELTSCLAITTT